MKVCGQEMKVTLPVYGRERTFSEQELVVILEKYFFNEYNEQASTAKSPAEGQWFEVDPLGINQELFLRKRKDERQEMMRRRILEAFDELQRNPEKYGRKFKTMMPKKTWKFKMISELKKMSCELGDHMANWVEQGLEWAQRVANGESWETICNKPDTANWYRAVVWKKNYIKLVGGAIAIGAYLNASDVDYVEYYDTHYFDNVVPLVVRYEK